MSDPGPPFCRVGFRELHEARLRAMVKQARHSVSEMHAAARTADEVVLLLAAAMVDAAEKRAIQQRASDDHRRAVRRGLVIVVAWTLVAVVLGVMLAAHP